MPDDRSRLDHRSRSTAARCGRRRASGCSTPPSAATSRSRTSVTSASSAPPVGACRMCMVEVEGIPKLQISCSTPVKDGMVVHTQTDRVKHAQNAVVEFLLVNHPLDCPVCDKGGECPLQDISYGWGPGPQPVRRAQAQLPEADRALAAGRDRPRALHPLLPLRALLAGGRRGRPARLPRARRPHLRRHVRRPPVRRAVLRQRDRAVPGRRADLNTATASARGRGTSRTRAPSARSARASATSTSPCATSASERVLARDNDGGRRRLALRQGALGLPVDPSDGPHHAAARSATAACCGRRRWERALDGGRRGPAPRPGAASPRSSAARPRTRRATCSSASSARRSARGTSTRVPAGRSAGEAARLLAHPDLARRGARHRRRRRRCWCSSATRSTRRRSWTCACARRCAASARGWSSRRARPTALDGGATEVLRFAPGAAEALLRGLQKAMVESARVRRSAAAAERRTRAERRGRSAARASRAGRVPRRASSSSGSPSAPGSTTPGPARRGRLLDGRGQRGRGVGRAARRRRARRRRARRALPTSRCCSAWTRRRARADRDPGRRPTAAACARSAACRASGPAWRRPGGLTAAQARDAAGPGSSRRSISCTPIRCASCPGRALGRGARRRVLRRRARAVPRRVGRAPRGRRLPGRGVRGEGGHGHASRRPPAAAAARRSAAPARCGWSGRCCSSWRAGSGLAGELPLTAGAVFAELSRSGAVLPRPDAGRDRRRRAALAGARAVGSGRPAGARRRSASRRRPTRRRRWSRRTASCGSRRRRRCGRRGSPSTRPPCGSSPPQQVVELNPLDAERLGLQTGDEVEVSANGERRSRPPCESAERRRGTASMLLGTNENNANQLFDGAPTLVEIEPATATGELPNARPDRLMLPSPTPQFVETTGVWIIKIARDLRVRARGRADDPAARAQAAGPVPEPLRPQPRRPVRPAAAARGRR